MKFMSVAFVSLCALALSGCGGNGGVACDSSKVKELVSEKMSNILIGDDPASMVFGKEVAATLKEPLFKAMKYEFDILSDTPEDDGKARACEIKVRGSISESSVKKIFQDGLDRQNDISMDKKDASSIVMGFAGLFMSSINDVSHKARYTVRLNDKNEIELDGFKASKE